MRKTAASNVRFGTMAAVARRQFCGKLHVITPQEVQWKPPLRQAAGTLSASGGQCGEITKIENEKNNSKNSKDKNTMKEAAIILSIFVLIVSSCNPQTTPKQLENNFASKLLDFPVIKDTADFISTLQQTYNIESDNFGEEPKEKITTFRKVNIYGSDDELFFVEYDYGAGCMATYPWKYQLLLTANGKLLKTFSGQRYDFIQIFPNQNPFLLIVNVTSKGNGGHEIYKISADTLENVYEGYYNCEVQTYDAHEDFAIYEPFELNLIIKDYNNDSFNDIAFVGKMVYIQGQTASGDYIIDSEIINGKEIIYSTENPYKKIPVEFIFLYDKHTWHFKAKEDYVKKYRLFN